MELQAGKSQEFSVVDGVLRLGERVYVPEGDDLRQEMLEEAHMRPYTMHLGTTKMYWDLRSFIFRLV